MYHHLLSECTAGTMVLKTWYKRWYKYTIILHYIHSYLIIYFHKTLINKHYKLQSIILNASLAQLVEQFIRNE